jgi:hypothetical protein
LYVSTTHIVVSGALVVEKEAAQGAGAAAKHQHPIYFVSEVLVGSKKYYSEIEKICYAVVMCSRKLQHYFEAHTIRVLTNQPSLATGTAPDVSENGRHSFQNKLSTLKGATQ